MRKRGLTELFRIEARGKRSKRSFTGSCFYDPWRPVVLTHSAHRCESRVYIRGTSAKLPIQMPLVLILEFKIQVYPSGTRRPQTVNSQFEVDSAQAPRCVRPADVSGSIFWVKLPAVGQKGIHIVINNGHLKSRLFTPTFAHRVRTIIAICEKRLWFVLYTSFHRSVSASSTW